MWRCGLGGSNFSTRPIRWVNKADRPEVLGSSYAPRELEGGASQELDATAYKAIVIGIQSESMSD